MTKTGVLIAGMHRSGTSAFTRTLNLLGCDVPKTPSNDPEHWESRVVMDLNDAILAAGGRSWSDWEAFDAAAASTEEHRERARAALESEFASSGLFVLKDPRICRVLGLWIEATRDFDVDPVVVMPIRNPLEVAASLEERDGIHPSIGLLIWLRYVLDAERASRDTPRICVRFEDLLADWRAVVDRLVSPLGVVWPERSPAVETAIDAFLEPARRHHRATAAALDADRGLAPWIPATVEIFGRWGRDEPRPSDLAALDAIRAAFDEATPAFSLPVAAGRREAQRNQRLDTRTHELHARLDRQGEEAAEMRTALEAERAKGREQRALLEAAYRELRALRASTSWRVTAPLRAAADVMRSRGRRAAAPAALRAAQRQPETAALQEARAKDEAILHAETAFRARDWPEAQKRWQAVLERFGDGEMTAGRAKQTISVVRRLRGLEHYERRIAGYRERRRRTLRDGSGPRIAVFTAICGGYDSLKVPETLDPRFDYVLFTDVAVPDAGVFRIEPMTFLHHDATRSARFVKTHPHLLLAEYDVAIWTDSSIMILGDLYPLVEAFLRSGAAVGGVPHPRQASVYAELEACLALAKDAPETMTAQIERYRAEGFEQGDHLETNFMMFDLRADGLAPFLASWWREIDRHSRRDQLSVGYTLRTSGTGWCRLLEPPHSARNIPLFALAPHDRGDGAARVLVDALDRPLVDPYAGPSFHEVRAERIEAQKRRRIDVVVCVHDALADVERCLQSIRRSWSGRHLRLVLVDDGSDGATARYLERFVAEVPWADLRRSEHATGYTSAANRGLRAATGDLVILLNSDTVVTDGWAEKLADAVSSTPGAGVVGPLSNAASHQSIPEHRGSARQTAVNPLPPGLSPEDVNRHCERWTVAGVLPRVPLVHGFCFGITRDVLDAVGYFDEESFPEGYGEENDYCLRAVDAGFSLVVATHTYVFHAKSRSYSERKRVALTRAAAETLRRLHGAERVRRAVASMQAHPMLVRVRERARTLSRPG